MLGVLFISYLLPKWHNTCCRQIALNNGLDFSFGLQCEVSPETTNEVRSPEEHKYWA